MKPGAMLYDANVEYEVSAKSNVRLVHRKTETSVLKFDVTFKENVFRNFLIYLFVCWSHQFNIL